MANIVTNLHASSALSPRTEIAELSSTKKNGPTLVCTYRGITHYEPRTCGVDDMLLTRTIKPTYPRLFLILSLPVTHQYSNTPTTLLLHYHTLLPKVSNTEIEMILRGNKTFFRAKEEHIWHRESEGLKE